MHDLSWVPELTLGIVAGCENPGINSQLYIVQVLPGELHTGCAMHTTDLLPAKWKWEWTSVNDSLAGVV